MNGPLLYLAAIAAAEGVTAFASPLLGVVVHILILLILIAHASLAGQHPARGIYLGLTLAPLIRILSLSMPLGTIPIIYWYAITALPLLAATFVSIRVLGYSRSEVGLTPGRLPLQVLIGLIGLPLGVVEYLILRPQPLADSFAFGALWLPFLILMIGTGFTEELIFRGVLQKAAVEKLRIGALVYVSLLFSVLHMGYYSAVELIFVFAVGLFFAWVAARSRSILGVTLAHGLLNSGLFLFVPLGISLLPLELPPSTGQALLPSAPAVVVEATPTLAPEPTPPEGLVAPVASGPAMDWPVPTSTPTGIATHRLVVANTRGLGINLRQQPGLSGRILRVWPEGTLLGPMGEEVKADGYTWWKVRDGQGNVGWAVSDNLQVAGQISPAVPLATPTALAVATPTRTPAPIPPREGDLLRYTVMPGDTLASIARRFGTTVDVLMALNDLKDRNTVPAYRQVLVPNRALAVHIVQPGETLGGIARANGTTAAGIAELNNIKDQNHITSGQLLLIPNNTGPG